jgi:3-carboxy-cis,cis-muconate cycloisomerase
MIGIFDNPLYSENFITEDMKKIFSMESQIQAWIDCELALAKAQNAVGIVPDDAYNYIESVADVKNIDILYLEEEIKKTGHPLMPFIKAFSNACGEYGGYIHWGSTTQDIQDTAYILLIRKAYFIIFSKLETLRDMFYEKAISEKDTLTIGRTNAQQALPVPLGLKFKIYYNEIERHLERLSELKERLFTAQFSGASGTLASMGDDALEIRKNFHEILNLKETNANWFSSRDFLVETVFDLMLITSTTGKFGNEIYQLQRNEIAEFTEGTKKSSVGSSTMPHKNNPFKSMNLVSLFRMMKSVMAEAEESLINEHERDARSLAMDFDIISRAFSFADKSVESTIEILENLIIHRDNMRKNIDTLHGLIYTEKIMMKLSEKLGRQNAHDIVHELSQYALKNDLGIDDLLMKDDRIKNLFSKEEIAELTDPEKYLGVGKEFI